MLKNSIKYFFRFKKLASLTLTNLTSIKYISVDAKICREFIKYIQSIIRYAKSANINNIFN